MDKVDLTSVEKSIKKLPDHIVIKLLSWAKRIEIYGLEEVRKIAGFHDEPLKGDRAGQRSIRLNKAIYTLDRTGTIRLIKVIEVNKHEY